MELEVGSLREPSPDRSPQHLPVNRPECCHQNVHSRQCDCYVATMHTELEGKLLQTPSPDRAAQYLPGSQKTIGTCSSRAGYCGRRHQIVSRSTPQQPDGHGPEYHYQSGIRDSAIAMQQQGIRSSRVGYCGRRHQIVLRNTSPAASQLWTGKPPPERAFARMRLPCGNDAYGARGQVTADAVTRSCRAVPPRQPENHRHMELEGRLLRTSSPDRAAQYLLSSQTAMDRNAITRAAFATARLRCNNEAYAARG